MHQVQQSRQRSAPLGSATAGRLEFTRGVSNLDLGVDPNLPDLYQAHFEGIQPEVCERGGVVAITYPQRLNPLDWRRHSAWVTLNGTVTWRVDIRGGASHVAVDLRRSRLEGFEVKGGASDLEIWLPEPHGRVLLRIAQGASGVAIHRPTGTPFRCRIGGGAARLTLDEQHFGAIGGETRWQSPDFAGATDYYDIVVERGASKLSVTAE